MAEKITYKKESKVAKRISSASLKSRTKLVVAIIFIAAATAVLYFIVSSNGSNFLTNDVNNANNPYLRQDSQSTENSIGVTK